MHTQCFFFTVKKNDNQRTRTSQGTLTGPEVATFTLDYTAAHAKCPEFNITFEGSVNGTLIIHNQTFSAKKYMSYTLLSPYILRLVLAIPKIITECYGSTSSQAYFFNVNLNDSACPTM